MVQIQIVDMSINQEKAERHVKIVLLQIRTLEFGAASSSRDSIYVDIVENDCTKIAATGIRIMAR